MKTISYALRGTLKDAVLLGDCEAEDYPLWSVVEIEVETIIFEDMTQTILTRERELAYSLKLEDAIAKMREAVHVFTILRLQDGDAKAISE